MHNINIKIIYLYRAYFIQLTNIKGQNVHPLFGAKRGFTGRVVTPVFHPFETIDHCLQNFAPRFRAVKVQISKNATHPLSLGKFRFF